MAGHGLLFGDKLIDHVFHRVLVFSRATPPLVMSVGPVGNGIAKGKFRTEPKMLFKTPTIAASPAVMAPTTLAGPAVRGSSRAAV